MTPDRIIHATTFLGMLAVVAGLAVSGCQRGQEATAVAPTTNAPPAGAADNSDLKRSNTPAGTALKVTVSLSPELAKQAAPDNVVFIFARATEGPRMPLAIVRKQVRDLPVTVILDDSLALGPHMTLSSVPEVVVVARVSRSGMAEARKGDLEGMSAPVSAGVRDISINIARVLTGQP